MTIALLTVLSGCRDEPPEYQEARKAFETLISGLRKADASALWELADDTTRRTFDSLAREMKAASECIRTRYPEGRRSEALRAVTGDLPGLDGTGQALFYAVVDRTKLRPPENPDSSEIARVERKGDVIRVVTKANESLEFIGDSDGKLRITALGALFEAMPYVKVLRGNIATAMEDCKAIASMMEMR